MKQTETIQQLKSIFPKVKGIEFAILYGSFARGTATANSDIDIQILISSSFNIDNFISTIERYFQEDIFSVRKLDVKHKIIVYFLHSTKIEFSLNTELKDIDKFYIGSEITNVDKSILYTHNSWKNRLTNYLEEIRKKKLDLNTSKYITELIEEFTYQFENASTMHKRSDAYQFYFFYNIALHKAIQLYQISVGNTQFNFLPKRFVSSLANDNKRKEVYELNGEILLTKANKQKRKLLDFFYQTLTNLVSEEQKEEIKCFCEYIFKRDYFWNFRDINQYNPLIKKGLIYRTANFISFLESDFFEELIRNTNIKTIIELRANREIEELTYPKSFIQRFKYVLAPFDPWEQPDWFKENYHYGTDIEIAYRFFLLCCKDSIRTALLTILNEDKGAIAIHCFAGKDRTGTLISLLHLLVGANMEVVYEDYLASEVDTEISKLNAALQIVTNEGGIIPYLLSCGLQQEEIMSLKEKLTYK
jgi:hypothetical protein